MKEIGREQVEFDQELIKNIFESEKYLRKEYDEFIKDGFSTYFDINYDYMLRNMKKPKEAQSQKSMQAAVISTIRLKVKKEKMQELYNAIFLEALKNTFKEGVRIESIDVKKALKEELKNYKKYKQIINIIQMDLLKEFLI